MATPYRRLRLVLAVEFADTTDRIVRAWWRSATDELAWDDPPRYAELDDVAGAIKAGHAVFARIKRQGHWRLGPRVLADADEHGRTAIYLDGGPDSVDEALTWLDKNWTRMEADRADQETDPEAEPD